MSNLRKSAVNLDGQEPLKTILPRSQPLVKPINSQEFA